MKHDDYEERLQKKREDNYDRGIFDDDDEISEDL